ncbi:MAG: RraA family protein [Alphaproteobacteria bacterium]
MALKIAFRRVRRPDPALVARAGACAMSDLYEALPAKQRDAALMSTRMRPLVPGLRIAGPAVTAQCAPGDNLMMHRALLLAEPGDVLVVAAAERPSAQWGYLAAVYAARKGLAGVIVDGCIRDTDVLLERRCPVWSTTISAAHPTKAGAGAVNAPIVCDGVPVRPGDLVSADTDGVLVVAAERIAEAVAGAEARAAREAADEAAIAEGRSLFELHDLEAAYARTGVREIDRAWNDPA